jgi:hypothetical protein
MGRFLRQIDQLSTHYIIYHTLILACAILSLVVVLDGHKRFLPLCITLFLTEIVEIIAHFAIANDLPFVYIYHIFAGFDYALMATYLFNGINSKNIRKIVLYSIPIFIGFSFFTSLYFYHFKGFPGLIINIEGFLLVIFSAALLLKLEPAENEKFFLIPDVWICLGILIFFGGTFFFNGIYTKLLNMDEGKAMNLFGMINKPLNNCLYLFVFIGLICLIRKKKSITL